MVKIFQLPEEPFAVGTTERSVEVPWALSCIGDAHSVLDVGYAYAEGVYLEKITNMNIPELHGVDASPPLVRTIKYWKKIIKCQADIRNELPYPDNYFDVILCISTIEHIGYDNNHSTV